MDTLSSIALFCKNDHVAKTAVLLLSSIQRINNVYVIKILKVAL